MNRLTRCCFFACIVLTCFPIGCGPEPKAPEPTVNPNPHKFTQLKTTVEPGAGVDNVDVQSQWTIGNISCAPIRPISGTAVTRQVNISEKVEKIDSAYVATAVKDRFVPGNCGWHIGGYEIDFKRGKIILTKDGVEMAEFGKSTTVKPTCIYKGFNPTLCLRRDQEAFLRHRFSGVFNATVEIVSN